MPALVKGERAEVVTADSLTLAERVQRQELRLASVHHERGAPDDPTVAHVDEHLCAHEVAEPVARGEILGRPPPLGEEAGDCGRSSSRTRRMTDGHS